MYCSRCGTQNIDTAKFCVSCGLDLTATTPVGAVRTQHEEQTEIDLVRQELRDEYEIIEELGRGGMAIVFRAREKQLDREVAIKVLPFSLAFDKEFVERFQREARTSARLEHPSIIPIYRVGKAGRVIYFVMKFLRGKPLSTVLAQRGAVPPGEIRRVLLEVARALAYAHKSGIVHRDIKPDNIMFDEHGQPVLTDFGIAKAASGGKLTGTGMAIGTPHYMSPEQARAQQLDGRSDLYSLGVVAYQCLAGQVPYDGEDSFSIGYKHIMEELPVPPLETQDKRDLFEVIRKMMAKSPAERFQTADELTAVLESGAHYIATGISTAATRAIPSLSAARIASTPTTPLPRAAGRPPPARPKHSVASGLFVWLLIVGTLLGAGGFYGYNYARKQGWLFARDTTAAGRDTAAAADTAARDTSAVASADTGAPRPDTGAAPRPLPPGTPGKLLLQGVPQGARVTLNGHPVRGSQLDLPPETYKLIVRAAGYKDYERQVIVTPGGTHTVRVELERGLSSLATRGPCEAPGPEYNRDNACFDERPRPLSATVIPIDADEPVYPRPVVLYVRVSPGGETLEVRIVLGSNVETFTTRAVEFAKTLRWNPAQKNGEPVEAWTQWQFQPQRQLP